MKTYRMTIRWPCSYADAMPLASQVLRGLEGRLDASCVEMQSCVKFAAAVDAINRGAFKGRGVDTVFAHQQAIYLHRLAYTVMHTTDAGPEAEQSAHVSAGLQQRERERERD